MNTFLIIVGIHTVLIGFGLVFGGVMALAEPTDEELELTREAFEKERQKSPWRACYLYSSKYRYRGLSLAIAHWPHRPVCRRLIYSGVVCLAIAAAIGYHFGALNS